MESVARDLNERPDIPFIDSEDAETKLGDSVVAFCVYNFSASCCGNPREFKKI